MTYGKGSTTVFAKARVVLSKQNLGSLERALAMPARLEWAANEDCMFRCFSKRFVSHKKLTRGTAGRHSFENN